jgi:cytochrome c
MMGTSSMRSSLLVAPVILACGVVTVAQAPTYNLGRTPSEQELRSADTAVGPDGQGLPPGSGTAKQGATVYIARNCAGCHGTTGVEGPGPLLVGTASGVANSAFAPQIWNTINQMMPLDRQNQYITFSVRTAPGVPKQCCLTSDEAYSLTAYLLHRNGIIQEGDVMNAKTLPQVQMPNLNRYAPPPYINSEWKPGMRKALVK